MRLHSFARLARLLAFGACLCVMGVCIAPGAAFAGDANSASCPNEANDGYRQYLPDCRAYELVTPQYKDGYIVHFQGAASSGDHVLGWTLGSFAGNEAPPQTRGSELYYEFSRGVSGWQTEAITPANPDYRDAVTFALANDELTQSLFKMPAAPAGQESIVERELDSAPAEVGPGTSPADGPVTEPGPRTGSNPETGTVRVVGANQALTHILFYVRAPFGWYGDTTHEGEYNLYEYATGMAGPRMVGVSGGAGSTSLVGECGVALGNEQASDYNAASESGETVFFTPIALDQFPECGKTAPQRETLYARLYGSETVDLSAVQCSPEWCESTPPSDAVFEGASSDGSRAFFLSTQRLVGAATQDSEPGDSAAAASGEGCQNAVGSGCNLYEYDFNRPAGARVRAISAGSSDPHVQGVVRISEDASHVYFVATSVLPSLAGVGGATPQANANNLYVFEPEVNGGTLRFVATLAPGDSELWGGAFGNDLERHAETTPDGSFLVFDSEADLTPDDTSQGVHQVFEYEDSAEPSLRRISIGNDGFNNDGNSSQLGAHITPAGYAEKAWVEPQRNAISANGSVVVFESKNALVEGAAVTKGEESGNIYEYREGHVYLLYGGANANDALLDMDPSGEDVFFRTTEALTENDTDTQTDIYDARSGGGLSRASANSCTGEACLGETASGSLVPGGQGSELVREFGNFLPQPHVAAKPPVLTKAQKLAKALKSCRKKKHKKARSQCERKARKAYGGKKK